MADEMGDGDASGSATIHHVSRRLIELRRLLELVEPIVSAQHGAEHMLDGFNLKPRPKIDSLLESLQRELSN